MLLADFSPAYVNALAGQFGFLGAFLGAISMTLFVTLLTLAKPALTMRISIGLAGFASLAFIVTAFYSAGVFSVSHPEAPGLSQPETIVFNFASVIVSFTLGIYALLGAIGTSGWSRSKPLGIALSVMAFVAAAFVSLAIF
ncbi:MAG: hypothetical protein AAF697_06215 [Pseudomonadota bacterium]